jgi:ribosomal protein L11 methylase PrmA
MMLYDPGSYRDPAGRVVLKDERVFRAIFEAGREPFEAARSAGVFARSIEQTRLLGMEDVGPGVLTGIDPQPCYVVEHPRLDFVSYPYEWCFSALRAAALFHLDFQLSLLDDGFTLSDATAYNVQFRNTKPVFIDHLSIIPYSEGQPWVGQRQFAMQFLNPLLLWSRKGIAPNAWYRGSLEGIPPEDLLPLLSWRDKMSFTVLAHVVAQAKLQQRAIKGGSVGEAKEQRLTRKGFEGILMGLRHFIAGLSLPASSTVWGDYDTNNSYDEDKRAAKHAFVGRLASEVQPRQLFDIGCNSGDYSQTALDHGAKSVVGFDFDFGALEAAFARFDKAGAPVLPLWLDATNPSPAQGWASAERKSFGQRAQADSMVALAFIHHLAIARNIPLDMAVDWLISLAPTGIIEFPDKGDAMVRKLLSTREDIFPDYTEEAFIAHVGARARIVEQMRIEGSNRLLLRFDRS